MALLRQITCYLCLGLLLVLGGTGVGQAGSSMAYVSDRITARLITAENGVAPGAATLSAALEVQLAEGWKTYWRSPGAVGYPAELDWSQSSNLKGTEFQWPTPTRFEAFEIENYGYADAVTFPIRLMLETPGDTAVLNADVNLLVCAELCVPEVFSLSLVLPPGTAIDREAGALIAAATERLPATGPEAGLEITRAGIDQDAARLQVTIASAQPFTNLGVIPDLGVEGSFGPPEISLRGGGTIADVSFDILSAPAELPALALVVSDNGRAAEMTPTLDALAAPAAAQGPGLAHIFLLALLGGLILNVMPCVLPVLTLKFASVLKAADQSTTRVRAGFLATALGVLTFMWALALALIALRASGGAVGWGIQFQSPVFLAVMAGLVTLFAANLFGLFEITLPQSWNTRMANAGGAGLAGDFATGALAAVLATPCSAPFLGTAVTFALAGSAPQTLAVFTALGLGLALPYLLVALWPRLIRGLPRPGPWMVWVRWTMGALLLATTGWLIWVLAGVVGPAPALVALGCFLLAIGLIYALQSGPLRRSAAAAMLGAGIAVPVLLAQPVATPVIAAEGPIKWSQFAPDEIAALVDDGQIVFVDLTADWCLSCKANKRLVLDRAPVAEELAGGDVTAMVGDWTRPNDAILAFLQAHDRFGIPFNIVYGPGAPQGIVLPELLTPSTVMNALEQAEG